MSEKLSLDQDQRRKTASRIIHDAELLKHGAEVEADGGISPSPSQKSALHRKHVLEPQRAEFLENTPEGQLISAHLERAERLSSAINLGLGNAGLFNRHDLPSMNEFRADAEVLDIDFDHLDERGAGGYMHKHEYLQELHRRDFATPLNDLTLGLIESPQLGLGNEVTVLRTGPSGELERPEAGWTVDDILLNGRLIVGRETSEGYLSKAVPIDMLQEWNAPTTAPAQS
jgi:hypothetical protein